MRMIQGQFPRLKDNLQLDEFHERKVIMNLMVLLYNYQTSKIGINTILNSYMSRTDGFDSYAFTSSGERFSIDDSANGIFGASNVE